MLPEKMIPEKMVPEKMIPEKMIPEIDSIFIIENSQVNKSHNR